MYEATNGDWTLCLHDRDDGTWVGHIQWDRPGHACVVLTDQEVRDMSIPAGPLEFLLGRGRT